jgi:hypothetical protein
VFGNDPVAAAWSLLQAGERVLKAAEAYQADMLLAEMSLVERIEAYALPEDGVATSAEIYGGLEL